MVYRIASGTDKIITFLTSCQIPPSILSYLHFRNCQIYVFHTPDPSIPCLVIPASRTFTSTGMRLKIVLHQFSAIALASTSESMSASIMTRNRSFNRSIVPFNVVVFPDPGRKTLF